MLMVPTEVFLSHASQDQEFATSLVQTLRRHGVPAWYSDTDIIGAQQWHDEIGDALNRCDWFVVVLSPSAVASMWVKRELIFALQQPRFENQIIPVLYQECDYERLSWVLSSIQRIDFQEDFDAGCRAMLRRWGVGYRPA